MKKKHSLQKDLLFLSVSSFILTACWVGFNVYHEWVTTTITPELQVQITPLNPSFDTATINTLKTRKIITPVTKLNAKTSVQPTPAFAENPPTNQQPAVSAAPAQPIVAPTLLPSLPNEVTSQ